MVEKIAKEFRASVDVYNAASLRLAQIETSLRKTRAEVAAALSAMDAKRAELIRSAAGDVLDAGEKSFRESWGS